jgi:hypothetical protein
MVYLPYVEVKRMKVATEINSIVQKLIEDLEDAQTFQDKERLIYGLLDAYDAIIFKYKEVFEKERTDAELHPKVIGGKAKE